MGLQGAIIAAGRGERLRRTAHDLPKPLVELAGEPLLVRQARAMSRAGAESVVAVINSETARRAEGIAMPPGLRLIVRDTASSMESLFAVGEQLAPGRFLLATVDSVMPQSELVRFTRDAPAASDGRFDGVLGVVRWRGDKRALFADVTKGGLITALSDRQTLLVTAGIYLLPTSIFDFAAKARQRRLAAMRSFLAMLLDEGIRLGAFEVHGAIDIDEASDLEAAAKELGGGR